MPSLIPCKYSISSKAVGFSSKTSARLSYRSWAYFPAVCTLPDISLKSTSPKPFNCSARKIQLPINTNAAITNTKGIKTMAAKVTHSLVLNFITTLPFRKSSCPAYTGQFISYHIVDYNMGYWKKKLTTQKIILKKL